MNELLQIVLPALQQIVDQYGTVFVRVGAICVVLPGVGDRFVPMRIKLALAFALTLAAAPLLSLPPILPDILGVAVEAGNGIILGLSLRLVAYVLQIVGSIAAQSTSLAQMMGAAFSEPMPVFGNVFALGGLAFLATLGFHVEVVAFVVESYQILPFARLPSAEDLTSWSVAHVADVFSFAVILTAPFVIGSLLYNLALGVINRAMPQLMVVLVGAPAISGAAIVLLMLSFPVVITLWAQRFLEAAVIPLGMP